MVVAESTVREYVREKKLLMGFTREPVKEDIDIEVLRCYDRPQPGLNHFDLLPRNRPAGEVIP
jgi:hypothetical protein